MKLEELRKKLYKPEPEFEERPAPPTSFELGRIKRQPRPEKEWEEIKPKRKWSDFFRSLFYFNPEQKKYFFIGSIILLLLLIGLVIFVYWYGKTSFDRTWVSLNISGPERIISGEEIVYSVKAKNNTKVVLKDVELTFYWSEASLPEENDLVKNIPLNNLEPGQEKETQFKGKIIGPKDSQKEVKASLSYQPKNIKARFENLVTFKTTIISVPLVLSFDLPEKITSGQQITVSLKYLNSSQAPFTDLVIKIEYPAGFKISSVYPQPQENIWQITSLKSQEEGKILISGILEGEKDEIKTFYGYLGIFKERVFIPYAQAVKSSQISLPVLSIEQAINDSTDWITNLSETLNYKIKYQNNSQLQVSAIKITAKLETRILDFTSLDLNQKGSFDSLSNTIFWDQTNAQELEFLNPDQSGQLNFSVKVKDNILVKNFDDKNFTILSIVKIESNNIPLALLGQQVSQESKLITKLNTRLTLDAKGYYSDTLLPNSGPLPPKVGQTTSYTIYFQITNLSNDLEETKVEAYLPSYIEWLNKFKPATLNLKYDSLTRKLTWEIGKLAAGTGILTPAKYIAFQIALTPSAVQIGQAVELIKTSIISGKDTFTGSDLKASDASIKTDLPDDPTMSWEKSRVVE